MNRGFEKISKSQWDKDTLHKYDLFDIFTYDEIILPNRKTAKSAGYDIISTIDFTLQPGEVILIPTGFKAYMQDDEQLKIHPRSGSGFKYFIRLANTTGIGDSDFFNNEGTEGHYWVKLRNEGDVRWIVNKGDGIAQCSFEKYLLADNDGFEGNKRVGGLGSTG